MQWYEPTSNMMQILLDSKTNATLFYNDVNSETVL